jgi:hypothetical protein
MVPRKAVRLRHGTATCGGITGGENVANYLLLKAEDGVAQLGNLRDRMTAAALA